MRDRCDFWTKQWADKHSSGKAFSWTIWLGVDMVASSKSGFFEFHCGLIFVIAARLLRSEQVYRGHHIPYKESWGDFLRTSEAVFSFDKENQCGVFCWRVIDYCKKPVLSKVPDAGGAEQAVLLAGRSYGLWRFRIIWDWGVLNNSRTMLKLLILGGGLEEKRRQQLQDLTGEVAWQCHKLCQNATPRSRISQYQEIPREREWARECCDMLRLPTWRTSL